MEKKYEKSAAYLSDPHGWAEWRAELLGTLGKVERKEVMPFLALVLGRRELPLDEVGSAVHAVASQADEKSAGMLREALKVHGDRGYRYRFSIQFAFGALEDPRAAAQIREFSKTCGSDLMGRIGWAVRDNQTLKTSREWAEFLGDLIVDNKRFGDEVKARILQTIEEVKTDHVRAMLQRIVEKSDSQRLREVSQKILEKNFGGTSGKKSARGPEPRTKLSAG